VVAFYDNGVTPIPVMMPVSDQIGTKYPKLESPTPVDRAIDAKLRKLGIVPSELCTDAEFLRRVSLDLTGTLPAPDEVTAFLADRAADKRARKIDELLERPGYAAWWATRFCDFTGNNPQQLRNTGGAEGNLSAQFSRQWYEWIRDRIERNVPYDEIIAGIVLAQGRTRPDQSYEEYAREMNGYFRKEDPADFCDRPSMPYYWIRRNVRKAEEKALSFAHTFLGVRIECAQCHKHPFDQWTKTDFEQFQAFFEPIKFGGKPDKGEINYQSITKALREKFGDKAKNQREMAQELQRMIDAGEVTPWQELYVDRPAPPKGQERGKNRKNPAANKRVLTPKILGGDEVVLTSYNDPREPLMEWLRDPENPYFAPSIVNRVWANHFGRGIVDPPDDMNLANPPVNEELMETLVKGFIESGYDLKKLHRTILSSRAYQRSWKANATNRFDEKNFSRATIRRLPAELVADALAMATAGEETNKRFPTTLAMRAIGPDVQSGYSVSDKQRNVNGLAYLLGLFGKPARETNCDCERNEEPTLLQTIYVRNDREILNLIDNGRTKGDGSWIAELRARHRRSAPSDVDGLIREAFLRTVSRPPTDEELKTAREDVGAAADPVGGVRDLLWALLNTREFLVNH
jgi:hypothetical protein